MLTIIGMILLHCLADMAWGWAFLTSWFVVSLFAYGRHSNDRR